MRGVVLLAAVLVAAAFGTAAEAHPGPVGQAPTAVQRLAWTGEPLFCGGRGKRVFALTFDDGPSPWTRQLVTVLRRRHATATFFLVGNRIPLWPRAARAEAALGAIGNHTWSHPELTPLPTQRIRRQLVWTQDELRRRLHVETQLFRIPYERTSGRVRSIVRSLGLVDVRWNVDSGDSRPGARPDSVAREVIRNLHPGAIVILHDMHPWTAKVVRQVLAAARKRHLTPVTIPELIERDPPAPHENCWATLR